MELNRKNYPAYPEKIIQFGKGNFLRCFFDWIIDIINEKTDLDAGIAVVRSTNTDKPPLLDIQGGLYTALIRGIDEKNQVVRGCRIISSVNREIPIYKEFDQYLKLAHNPEMRFIISNTTEAGIAFVDTDKYQDRPQSSFPGKLTRLLHERFKHFNGDKAKGFILLPCELIDYNGDRLKEIVLKYTDLWQLEDAFKTWLEEANVWCSTLVDRIVTGYPFAEKEELAKELGYQDQFITTGEYFHLLVIQGPQKLLERELKLNQLKLNQLKLNQLKLNQLKLNQVGLNIVITEDLKPYKTRKVAILNGAHTAMAPVSYLYGIDTVRETLEDEITGKFVEAVIYDEIIPALDMDKTELLSFAGSVISRFKNPYVEHRLLDISLNSMSKYRSRILPQVLSHFEKRGELPQKLVFALAAMLIFYKGKRNGEDIKLRDEEDILSIYKDLWDNFDGDYTKLASVILGMKDHWGADLTAINGFVDMLAGYTRSIDKLSMKEAIREVL